MDPTPQRPSSPASLFAHQGLMTPGVLLFRSIGFPAKAAWVSAAFALPLAVALWALFATATTNIAFSQKERLGTAYARPMVDLLESAQNRRRAATANAPDLADAATRLSGAFDAVAAAQARDGAALGTAEAFAKLESMHRRLLAQPREAEAVATFAAHTAFVRAALALLRDAGDGSNLTLDPELDTYYMMAAATIEAPRLIEGVAQLRGMGNRVLRERRMSVAQRDTVASALAATEDNASGMKIALERAIRARPELQGRLPVERALTSTRDFLATARTQLIDRETPEGDPDAFLRAGDVAVSAQYALARATVEALDEAIAARIATLQRTMWMQIAIALAGIAVALYLLVAFYRVTRGGLAVVSWHLERMSDGDLTGRPTPWGRDEAAQLMLVLSRTGASLSRLVSQTREAIASIEVASGEIASASTDLSQRTERTAARLQTTASDAQAIAALVRDTAAIAAEASGIVAGNADTAGRGATVMDDAVRTMHGIREASQRIADIIGTIDGIAFQTNILALNAAVEAARAGDAGRGFAVVAAEVRALAQRAADAAREVKTLIEANGQRVDSGQRVIDEAGRTMRDIVGNAGRLGHSIASVAGASAEQSSGVSSIEQAVAELDAATQQNAALVEQTAATAANLHASTERLVREMAHFRVD